VLALDSSGGIKPAKQGDIAERFGVSRAAVSNVKRDFEEGGLDRLLSRKKRKAPPVPPKADGEFETHLIALSCMEPPLGYGRWTVRLLAGKCMELEYIDSVSYSTVSRVLKKTNSSLT
jgi:transposase